MRNIFTLYYMQGANLNLLHQELDKSARYNLLTYRYVARAYLADSDGHCSNVASEVCDIATSGFAYFQKYRHNLESDPTLSVVTKLCASTSLINQVDFEDCTVETLAKLFNQLINSNRSVFKCYDCGTSARAIFLSLIQSHRQLPISKALSNAEIKRFNEMYRPNSLNPDKVANECQRLIANSPTDILVICSLGLGESGHIWVLHKKWLTARKSRTHMYQSALNSHLLIDFIERQDYGAHPNKTLNLKVFFQRLIKILTMKHWTESHRKIFGNTFAYLPGHATNHLSGIDITPSFCYTYVTLPSLHQ